MNTNYLLMVHLEVPQIVACVGGIPALCGVLVLTKSYTMYLCFQTSEMPPSLPMAYIAYLPSLLVCFNEIIILLVWLLLLGELHGTGHDADRVTSTGMPSICLIGGLFVVCHHDLVWRYLSPFVCVLYISCIVISHN